MNFYEHIVALRKSGKIPFRWTIADIEPFLRGNFLPNTINVYPQNCSISPDGSEKGDYVKRGQKPKFYRLGRATFELIEEVIVPTTPCSVEAKGQPASKGKSTTPEGPLVVFNTRDTFWEYMKICNKVFRPGSQSLFLYQEIINRRKMGDLPKLIGEDGAGSFLKLAYQTLIEWGMDSRAAKLVDFQTFKDSVSNYTRELEELSSYRICDLNQERVNDLLSKIMVLFTGIRVMSSKCHIVGGSKTLHFLLPDLVMPIDRTYTLTFYYGKKDVCFPTIKKEINIFNRIFTDAYRLVQQLSLSQADVDGYSWNQSIPKLVDNAIIGYIKSH